jgi:tetratricopeptide (TPR) repeat protein
MGNAGAERTLVYTSLFAAGSILACPAVGMSAGVVVAATAVATLFGGTLASDIQAAVTAGSLDPLSNNQLQQLVGNALAVLIECYEKEKAPPNFVQRLVPIFRRPDAELSALAKAARKHWDKLQLTAENVALRDSEIHRAFSEHDPTSPEPLVSADEWERHLADIAMYAQTWFGDQDWLRNERRRALAEYIAPRFAVAVRELVKADLDPSIGTGGRVFIALHLDLMRAMSVSIRKIDAKTDDVLKNIKSMQRQFDALTKLVIRSLSGEQKAGSVTLVAAIRSAQKETRSLMRERFAALEHKLDINCDMVIAEIRDKFARLSQSDQVGDEPLDYLLNALRRLAKSGESRGVAAMRLAQVGRYVDAGKEAFELAEDEAAVAAHLAKAAEEARTRAAARWFDAGDINFFSDFAKAADAYQRSIDLDPMNPYAWSHLGEVFWWLGRLPDALRTFTHLWRMLPEGIQVLARAVDEDAARRQEEQFLRDHSDIPRDVYLWTVRGIIIAGLNIIEILRREPRLVSEWIIRLEPLGREGELRTPTGAEAPEIVEFFTERVYSLGSLLGKEAAQTEHRRTLESLARIALRRGELAQSDEYLRRAREMSVALQDFVAEAVYLSNLGIVVAQRGQMNTARSYLEQALAICEGDRTKPRLIVGKVFVTPEEAERRRLESEQAIAAGIAKPELEDDEIEVSNLLREEFAQDTEAAMRRALKLKETEGNVHGNLGKIAMTLGDIDLAKLEYKTSLSIHESIGFIPGIAATSAL